jgi:hypothetical protein
MNELPRILRILFFTSLAVSALVLGFGAGGNGLDVSDHPPFSIQQHGETSWLVRPNGERFFSLGVCCVSQGASRKDFDSANPAYAAWQHYADSNLWAKVTLKRLKSWGFTTVGGWSDFQVLRDWGDPDVAFAPVLHIGSTAGAPWWDMWNPKIIDHMDAIAREQIVALERDLSWALRTRRDRRRFLQGQNRAWE